ncbi:MAG: helix-turn-helix domain-containing protein [Ruminococcaceae bacterium]|nr:helix-turn-helix domain-containing protein [Oscillospiraceae bacterium]
MKQKKKRPIPFYEKTVRSSPHKMLHAHFHEKHELYYLEKGKTKYFIENELFLLEAGDMIFVPKQTFHKTDNSEDSGVERILFTFDDADLGEDMQKYLSLLYKQKLIRMPPDKQYEVQSIFRQISQEEEKKQIDYAKMQQLYFKQLLILISRHCEKAPEASQDPTLMLVQDIAKYISEHVSADLSLSALSRKYALSACYLSRTFKENTGIGLNEYINISRITLAEQMLLSSKMTVTEVSFACGYNDSNYFSSVFKKLKGVTPKKYMLTQAKK